MLFDIIKAHLDGLHIQRDQFGLGAKALLNEGFDDIQANVGERCDGADISHILHQDAGARIVEFVITHARQRNTDNGHIVARRHGRAWPG